MAMKKSSTTPELIRPRRHHIFRQVRKNIFSEPGERYDADWAQSALGLRTSPSSRSRPASSISRRSSTPGRAASLATPSAGASMPACSGSTQGSDRLSPSASRLHPSLRSRLAVCRRRLSRRARPAGLQRIDGPTGNPYDNAKAESFMKTLKVEEVYLMEYEPSRTSRPRCRASSKRSTMPSAAIRHSATKAPPRSKRTTPGRCQISSLNLSTQGVHSNRRRRVDHPLGCGDAAPRLEARSEA